MKGNKVVLRGGSDPFTGEAETEEWFVTQIPYERIVISGKGYVSTEAIGVLAGHNVNVILLDSFGNLITNMCKTMSSGAPGVGVQSSRKSQKKIWKMSESSSRQWRDMCIEQRRKNRGAEEAD
jgi:CRISPR/Cas system-associated endonuclease Cas1